MFFLSRPSCKRFSFNFLLSISTAALVLIAINSARSMEEEAIVSPMQSVVVASPPRGLKFLDENQPQDELNFLSTKYPELVKESRCVPNIPANAVGMISAEFLNGLKTKILASPYDPRMFENNEE